MSLPDDFADAFPGMPGGMPAPAAAAGAATATATRTPSIDEDQAAADFLAAAVPSPRRAPQLGPEATDLPPLPRPDLPDLGDGAPLGTSRDLGLLAEVQVELAVELGRVKLPLRDLLALGPGAVLELDRAADAPVDVLVNGCLVARGEVVVIDGDFGVRITAVVER